MEGDAPPAKPAQKPPVKAAPQFYPQIIGLFKLISNNYQDKDCLNSLVEKYGKSEVIAKLPLNEQEKILGELHQIHEDNKSQQVAQ